MDCVEESRERSIGKNLSDFERRLISASENIHREDLTSAERENLIHDLWEKGKEEDIIENQEDLANKLRMGECSRPRFYMRIEIFSLYVLVKGGVNPSDSPAALT